MPEVYNWQLGRKMLYPYEERHPKWQFAFVFNINRCLACQTCSMADKSTWLFSKGQEYMWWNNVETKPYGGYAQFYDVKITQLIEQVNPGGQVWNVRVGRKHHAPYGVFEGMTIFDAGAKVGQAAIGYIPTDQEWRFVNIYEDTATSMRALVEGIDKIGFSRDEPWKMTGSSLPEHETFFFYLQRICNHCTYPGCLAACPRKAIYKRPEDGIVLIDQNRCRGYKKCVEQCPYKKPMYRGTTRVSEKCIACYPRIEGKDPLTGGEPMETRCMAACVGKIRMQSLMRIGEDGLWAEDRWHPLYYAIRVEQVALPLYPQWGTEPNGFYIPPRHSPRGYARQMFGPGVDNAIEKYLVPSRELLAVLQLWRASQQIVFRYDVIPGPKVFETQIHGKRFEMYNDTVLGFNKSGKEVARIQVEEPIYIRPAERVTWL